MTPESLKHPDGRINFLGFMGKQVIYACAHGFQRVGQRDMSILMENCGTADVLYISCTR